tara:strand:+ start:405 stop:632 length:228 start_codon:yes stop_codon:yes gene_type:complete
MPEQPILSDFGIKYIPYSIQDHYAISHLAKVNNTSKAQIIKIAVHEWIRENLPKELELAAVLTEIKLIENGSHDP